MLGSHILLPLVSTLNDRLRNRISRRPLSPIQVIALSFMTVVLAGSLLLFLPISQQGGQPVDFLNCLFTATSATCVTGLVTVSTADTWTTFGQVVILLMIQVGGLGYMTIATIVALLLGLRVNLRARLLMKEAHGAFTLLDAVRIVRYVALGTFIIEGIGAVLLMLRFHYHMGMTWGRALYEGTFHSISAFCNAGFDLAPGFAGLAFAPYRTDIPLLLIIGFLIILGGLGFGVLAEVIQFSRVRRLSLHAKLVLSITIILIGAGMLVVFLFEAPNPETFGQIDNPLAQLVTTWFMAVTPRTAGFTPVDLTVVSPPTLFFLAVLMFIGASPDSTGGGIKTTTLGIITLAILSIVRRRQDIEAFKRRISGELVRLSLSLATVYLFAVLLIIIGISLVEITFGDNGASGAEVMTLFSRIVFEVFSAFGTVGLSAGLTPQLEPLSRFLLIIAMYLGRLGPLAFIFIFAQPKPAALRRLPSEAVMAGG